MGGKGSSSVLCLWIYCLVSVDLLCRVSGSAVLCQWTSSVLCLWPKAGRNLNKLYSALHWLEGLITICTQPVAA